MIRKAIKRPDEIEYIEFKGRENFEEVSDFTGRNLKLIINSFGNEYISLEDAMIEPGTIFYRNVYDDKPRFKCKDKKEFFKMYMEEL